MCKTYLILILLLCVIVASFLLGAISHIPPMTIKGSVIQERPYRFYDPSVRWGEIRDFTVCEDILYVLFDSKEVLDCYSLDGTYLHSYYIELGRKGKAELFVCDSMLYLKSKGFAFYTFRDGIFVESYEVSPTELYAEITRLSGNKGDVGEGTYMLRGSSIYKNMQGTVEKIVHRPGWMVIFQGSYIMLIGSVSFVLLCFILYYYKKRA